MIKRGRHISCQRASIHKQGVTYIYMRCPAYTNRVLRAAQHTQTGSTCHARHRGCYVYIYIYIHIYINNAVYIYVFIYTCAARIHKSGVTCHACSKRPRLFKPPEPSKSVRGCSKRPRLVNAAELAQSALCAWA